MSTEVADVLRKALEAFGPNGERWVKGFYAKDSAGCQCMIADGVSFCSEGALLSVTSGSVQHFTEAYREIAKFISPIHLVSWNDSLERTFADVKALFEKAIAEQEHP